MPETGTSGSMSGDGKRDDTFVSTRAHPRLYRGGGTLVSLLEGRGFSPAETAGLNPLPVSPSAQFAIASCAEGETEVRSASCWDGGAKAPPLSSLVRNPGYLPQEPENWDVNAVFASQRYVPQETWLDKEGTAFRPGTYYYVGGSSKMYGAAMLRLRERDFEELEPVRQSLRIRRRAGVLERAAS